MELMDSHPARDDSARDDSARDDSARADNARAGTARDDAVLADAGPAPAAEAHWLSALLRVDALAITSLAITAATVFGLPFLHDVFSLFLYNPAFINSVWQYVPGLVAAGVGIAIGLLALRLAAAQYCAGWVKTTAAASVLISVVVAAGTALAWLYAPDAAEIFGDVNL